MAIYWQSLNTLTKKSTLINKSCTYKLSTRYMQYPASLKTTALIFSKHFFPSERQENSISKPSLPVKRERRLAVALNLLKADRWTCPNGPATLRTRHQKGTVSALLYKMTTIDTSARII